MDRVSNRGETTHSGRTTTWKGKRRKDPSQAIEQAIRWQQKEPCAEISVVAHDGSKISLLELEQQQRSEANRC
jgi:hypothetical protein